MPRSKRPKALDPWAPLLAHPEQAAALIEEFRAQREQAAREAADRPQYDVQGSRFD